MSVYPSGDNVFHFLTFYATLARKRRGDKKNNNNNALKMYFILRDPFNLTTNLRCDDAHSNYAKSGRRRGPAPDGWAKTLRHE